MSRQGRVLGIVILWLAVASSVTVGQSDQTLDTVTPSAATLNAVPPQHAIVLFDGSNLDGWLSQKNKDWENSDGPADWKILSNGYLEVVPGTGSIITKRRFQDFHLHLEFRLQSAETNGGVYLLARYELNISDSQQRRDGSACGAFANLATPLEPRVAAAAPIGQWQTFDVDFRAPRLDQAGQVVEEARATVLLNGVNIHDDVRLGARKGAAKRLGDAPDGVIMLQEHGTAYQFRNIWIIDGSFSTNLNQKAAH